MRYVKRFVYVSVCFAVMMLSGARVVEACTCGYVTCGEMGDNVFEATVSSIEQSAGIVTTGRAASATFINGGGMMIVKLKDVRVWRGREAPTMIVTGQGGGDCGYEFKAGERYLIDAAHTDDGRFAASICSLTRPIRAAAGMIAYLQALRESPRHTRVWGTVARVTGWEGFDGAFTPVQDAQVTLNGPRRATVTTDADGRFVVTDLPKGMYSLTVRVNGSLVPSEPGWGEFLFGRDGVLCEELSIEVPATGKVDVAVLDEDGQPMRGAEVYLHSADHVDQYGDRPGWGLTLPEGRATVEEVPPGRYVIAMNPGHGPMPGSPYLEAFSPIFMVEDGKTATPPPLRPQRASMIKISGIVREPSGTPLANVQVDQWIQLSDGKRSSSWPHPKTDTQGKFQVDLWKDQRYVITVGPEREPWGRIEFIADGHAIDITARPR